MLTILFLIRSDMLRRVLLIGSIGVLTVLVPDSMQAHPWFHITIIPFARYFLTGFLLLDFYLKELPKYPEKTYSWDVVSLIAWSVFIALLYTNHPRLLTVPILLAYYAGFKGVFSNRFFTHPFTYTIGGMCYSIYLYHFQLISVFGRLFVHFFAIHPYALWVEISITGLVAVPLILLVSTLLFILMEKPCMRRGWYLDASAKLSTITGRINSRRTE